MAFTPNVVDGDIILASWGNQIRDRTWQSFASVAERDSQWPASVAPIGAHCTTVDTGSDFINTPARVWTTMRAAGSIPLAFYNTVDLANVNPGTGGGITPVSALKWVRIGPVVVCQASLVIGTAGFGLGTTTAGINAKLPYAVDTSVIGAVQRAGVITFNASPVDIGTWNLQATAAMGFPACTGLIREPTHGGTWTSLAASAMAAGSQLWGTFEYITSDP